MRKNPIKKSDDIPVENTSQTKKKTWSKRIFGTKKNGKSDTKQKSSQYESPSGLVLSSSSSGSASKTGEEPKAPKRTPVSPETPKTPALPRYFPGEPAIVKKVLSRPFGRDTLLVKDFKWIVRVSHAEWEPEESIWKYRIFVQKREANGEMQDYTNGMTFRSLSDFYWLEQALIAEFNGGLLLPSLSITLGIPHMCDNEVDAKLLSNWLSDTLNGVRGHGELILRLDSVDVISTESMEAFLYRADLVEQIEFPNTPGAPAKPESEESDTIWNWVPELCTGGAYATTTNSTPKEGIKKTERLKEALDRVNCSSPALGTAATFNVQNSFAESPTFDEIEEPVGIHPELLKAEKDLVWSWRTRALRCVEKLRVLQEHEKHLGVAWKRFAITVLNLFSYEKDAESARLGNSKSRQNLQMPYRKLQKSVVDNCLRVMARQKVDRTGPSLERLGVMLNAYVADLCAVQPSVQAYLEGLQLLEKQHQLCETLNKKSPENEQPTSLTDQIQSGIFQVKKQLVEEDSDPDRKKNDRLRQEQRQLQTIENRVLVNEALLKDFLTTFCQTAPVRTARMAHLYFDMESKQCETMHGAAASTLSKMNVASKEMLSRMMQRHQMEAKEDLVTELQIAQRIVNIGNANKFSKDDGVTEEVERGVEINKDGENEIAKLRDNAIKQCRERMGRWDAKTAMSIMEAVGVSEANVRVEETTRDLRMVRKYAIGLRENLQRCVEALENLRTSVLQGSHGDIRGLRRGVIGQLQALCSVTYDRDRQISTRELENAGIYLDDSLGWKKPEGCGGAINAYMDARDSSTEWLMESLGELLKDYNKRLEAVESFVYMECVGIQLEKHFSQTRAANLSAFEKKTDITSAINIATRKRMPALVEELKAKLEAVGADVSHTMVKESKEAHLESKALKQELHSLAMRRLTRSRETSTERVIALMTVWAKEEEGAAATELKLAKAVLKAMETSARKDQIEIYLDASPDPG